MKNLSREAERYATRGESVAFVIVAKLENEPGGMQRLDIDVGYFGPLEFRRQILQKISDDIAAENVKVPQ